MGESYRNLIAWQKSMRLVTEIYEATRAFPRDELYGLTSQLRRAAVSFQVTSPRDKRDSREKSFTIFFASHEGLSSKSRLSSSSQRSPLLACRTKPTLASGNF
jgi:23S rRNA-intervening sequence protein